MTILMSLGDVLEVVAIVGGIFAAVVGALVAYLLIRSPRRGREAAPPEGEEALSQDEMLALMDRMERRLETLERLVAQDEAPARIAPRAEEKVSEAVEDRESGRTK